MCRPLNLGSGCCVCWKDEDKGKILICDGCEQEYHIYCLHPPLTELPEEDGELNLLTTKFYTLVSICISDYDSIACTCVPEIWHISFHL